jgi:signal transduction histidine kinase
MKFILNIFLLLAILFGIYLTNDYDYLLFHGLAEMFSIVIACGVFMVVWNTRRLLQSHYLLFIGIAYLYVGGLDFLHLLAYKGMGVFQGYGANLPTQLWVAGRYLESLSLLSGTIFFHRKLSARLTFAVFGLLVGTLLASIFYWNIFPVCFIEGVGLTRFKIDSEYVICLIFLAAIGLLIKNAGIFNRKVLALLVASISTAIGQELAFTTYLSVYGLSNMIGHFLKIISFYLLYKAIIETSLVSPFNLLFRDLKQSEEALKKAHDELDRRVRERTAELSGAVEKLRIENIQRRELEATLRESENRVRFFASQYLTAQEDERRRIAGELHDSIAASLSATKYGIERVAGEMEKGQDSPESLKELAAKVTEVNNEVRRIMADLRPAILDDLGIVAAMSWFCREYEKTYSHIAVERRVGLSEEEVPEPLKTPIFRISQEAMNNIAKYSQASLVIISLRKENGIISLIIEDNGQGFDPERIRRGLGLSTMRERARLSGGSFDLESKKGMGTVVRATWIK